MKVLTACILSCFAVVSGSKCDAESPLPKPSPMSNVKKMTGIWYQTVSSNDYISAQYICGTFSMEQVDVESGGFTASLVKYYSKADSRTFNVYIRKSANGYFERSKLDYREVSSHDFDQYGRLNVEAVKEDYPIDFNPGKITLITDGIHYFAYVKCTTEGWAVWIFTPQKVLTTEQLLYIHNELIKHGIHTELRLGKCEEIILK